MPTSSLHSTRRKARSTWTAYKATGDREILVSVERQMNQLIDMMHRLGFRLQETGATQMNGMPSMSLLKPLVMLYEETGSSKYLDYAAEMLPDWDREDASPQEGRTPGHWQRIVPEIVGNILSSNLSLIVYQQ